MKKKALMILLCAVFAFSAAGGPALTAAAEEVREEAQEDTQEEVQEEDRQQPAADDAKSLLEQGTQMGQDLYQKMDEAVDSVDKNSLRRSIREALEEMDEMGISPSAVARDVLGIRTKYEKGEKAPENTLIRDAQGLVRKKTEGFFTVLWDGFLDTVESIVTNGISIFSGLAESGERGGEGL